MDSSVEKSQGVKDGVCSNNGCSEPNDPLPIKETLVSIAAAAASIFAVKIFGLPELIIVPFILVFLGMMMFWTLGACGVAAAAIYKLTASIFGAFGLNEDQMFLRLKWMLISMILLVMLQQVLE